MAFFTDSRKTAEIELKDTETGVSWEDGFYDTASLLALEDFPGWEPDWEDVYCVVDVDYLIDQARDMIAGKGDFDQPKPEVSLAVNEVSPTQDGWAAPLASIEAHREAIASSIELGRPCLDKGLFAAACDAYEMFSDAKGYAFWLELNCGGPIGIGVTLGDKGMATVYATTPDGPRKIGARAYEDFRDFVDVADWLDECQQTAYDEYMPEELKEQ